MSTTRRTLGIALVSSALVACGGGGTGPSPASLTATWHATKAEFVSIANPAEKAELIGMGGSVVLTLNESKTFSMTFTSPGEPLQQYSGTWSSSIDVLTLTYTSGSWQFQMDLNGDTLLLTGANGQFDVNGDDTDEAVKINLTLARS